MGLDGGRELVIFWKRNLLLLFQELGKIFELLLPYAELGVCIAQRVVAMCFTKLGEPEKELQFARLSAQSGYPRAQPLLGFCYEMGHGVEKDLNLAGLYYKIGADLGMARSQNNIGNFY